MAPRSPQQFKHMREQSRRKILDTALELFAANGFHTTSVDAIASQAGVSKGLIYNYFESKEQLLEELVMGTMRDMMASFEPVLREPDARAQVRAFVEQMFAMVERDPHFWRLYWSLLVQPSIPKQLQDRFLEFMHEMLGLFADAFSRIGSTLPLADAWLFAASMDGLAMYYLFDPERCPIDDIKTQIYRRYGLSADSEPPSPE